MQLRRPPHLATVQVLVPAPWKRYIIGAFFVALYGVSLNRWYTTAGHAYERALEAEKTAVKKKADENKEKGVSFQSGSSERKDFELEIDYASLPSQMLPDPWTCGLIFANICGHILFHMMCVWSVGFKAAALFQPGRTVRHGCFMRVSPKENKGKADICAVEESEVSLRCTFHFQYQTYECLEPGEKCDDLVGDEDSWGARLIQCPVGLTWKEYRESKGLSTEGAIEKMQDKFGTNVFDLPQPTFMQLFSAQLMAPLAIFQFFCTALWMMDTYWQYTCFTLFSILSFEASTAFQRLKSMSTLRGMSTKSYSVYVYRKGIWGERPIEELLPGDIVSLTAKKAKGDEAGPSESSSKPQDMTVTVPCDALILRGSAIVNEATLTGESVPQMKDAVSQEEDDTRLDVFGKHRMHTVFSGTSMIQVTPAAKALEDGNSSGSSGIPDPPNAGIMCYVLRTGFNSSQGELMRMIEFSTQDVSADKVETACLLVFLLAFALVAAGFVLKKGLEDPTRPIHKTLLRCTQIITSVVPPSLPMQMAFAVHTALMALLKAGIFCTEPFRVPYAGKVKYCFFDKTGTLTSDQMVAVAVVNDVKYDKKPHIGSSPKPSLAVKDTSVAAAMVLAGCHSLIEVDGKNIGDPIEVAALKGIGWSYVPASSTASPGLWRAREQAVAGLKEAIGKLKDEVEADKKEKAELTKKLEEMEKTLKDEKAEAKKMQVTIESRYHFNSELQRMSTVCRVSSQGSDKVPSGTYCLAKGSPEAIGRLLTTQPEWYEATYRAMAEKGQRVLALAYRQLDSNPGAAPQYTKQSRSTIEQDLSFAGFIAFKCETRKDTSLVVKALQDSLHHCVMLTGDAPLTALSVAHEVGIAQNKVEDAYILTQTSGGLEWAPAITSGPSGAAVKPKPFKPSEVEELSQKHDLVVPGPCLEAAMSGDDVEGVRSILHIPRILARLSPSQKEQIIQAVKASQKVSTMMCGDGGNDVGALREADVGIALLNGFGNANVSGDKKDGEQLADDNVDAESALAEQKKEMAQRQQAVSKKAGEDFARKRRELVSKQQEWVEEEMEARRQRGEDTGVMGHMAAVKAVYARLKDEMKKEQESMQKKHGNAFAAGAAKSALSDLEGLDETPMVQLGDASTAAPFTSRSPSISPCIDIIRQGRCTLLSAVQQMQIMMMESMVAAYTMSAMSVDGTRPSQAQMMAGGILLSIASLAFSFARPVDRMHKVRPLSSVFHPAMITSLLGQLAIHLGCMVYLASLAREIMGPEKLQEIVDFEKDYQTKLAAQEENEDALPSIFGSVPFKNNLLNTCCWLVETAQQISVMFVNYKGQPWMKGLLENQPLFLSLFACFGLVAICAWGIIPQLNELLNLEVIPEELRFEVMVALFLSLVGAFIWDRLMVFIFAREIFDTMVEGALALSLKDFYPLFKTVGYVLFGGAVLVTGNPLLMGLAFMMYRSYSKAADWNTQQAAGATNGGAGGSSSSAPKKS